MEDPRGRRGGGLLFLLAGAFFFLLRDFTSTALTARFRDGVFRPILREPAHRATSTDGGRSPGIKAMVTSPEYRHAPTGTLAVLAQRLGQVWAFPSTW